MRQPSWPDSRRPHLLAAALLWLLVGGLLLLTTLVPLHSAQLGWTPAFWLVGAPLIVLLGLPRKSAARARPRRRPHDLATWH